MLASRNARKLRYICRLFCKELVRHNFPGMQVDELLGANDRANLIYGRAFEITFYPENPETVFSYHGTHRYPFQPTACTTY